MNHSSESLQQWRVMGSSWAYSQLARSASSLEFPKYVTGIWGEGILLGMLPFHSGQLPSKPTYTAGGKALFMTAEGSVLCAVCPLGSFWAIISQVSLALFCFILFLEF